MKHALAVLLTFSLGACAAAPTAQTPAVISGRMIAERSCGACHSTSDTPSRLADAPPFRELHRRYHSRGGLEALLSEGMLTPEVSLEEGVLPGHPRMPMVALTAGEREDLAAYLRSLEPVR
jgi:cytochrome c